MVEKITCVKFLNLLYLPPATKLGQGCVFTRVCDSVHGGGMCGCRGTCMVAGVCGCGGHVWLLGGMHGCQGACMGAGGAWLPGGVHRIRRATVNERAVRILLE